MKSLFSACGIKDFTFELSSYIAKVNKEYDLAIVFEKDGTISEYIDGEPVEIGVIENIDPELTEKLRTIAKMFKDTEDNLVGLGRHETFAPFQFNDVRLTTIAREIEYLFANQRPTTEANCYRLFYSKK